VILFVGVVDSVFGGGFRGSRRSRDGYRAGTVSVDGTGDLLEVVVFSLSLPGCARILVRISTCELIGRTLYGET
jgi:hypothetical protein